MVRFRFASGSVRFVNFSTGDTVCKIWEYKYFPLVNSVMQYKTAVVKFICMAVAVQ